MTNCAVAGCKNHFRSTRGTTIKYYGFPKNPDLCQKWIVACGRRPADEINLKNARICSIHFDANCFEIPLKQRLLQYCPRNSRNLRTDAVPTLNIPRSSPNSNQKYEEPSMRLMRTEPKKIENNVLENLNTSETQTSDTTSCDCEGPKVKALLPIEFVKCDNEYIESETDGINPLNKLREEIEILKKQNTILLKQNKIQDSKLKKYETILLTTFTRAQIRKLMKKETDLLGYRTC